MRWQVRTVQKKTTLAATIMGLSGYEGYRGQILFKGTDVRGMSIDQRAELGITLGWQEPARFEGLTVDMFLQASNGHRGVDPAEALKAVGMDPGRYLERALDTSLSGGERKKVELASILSMRPALVLLDEPDSGIDVASLEKKIRSA